MTVVEVVPSISSESAEATLWSRWSDRLNPILVREVQQAVKGRVFALTILLALAISVVIAAVVAGDYTNGGTGRGAFDAGFATLVPLLLFIIPMQAYNSMRTELKGGIVEQLLLSRLSPSAVLLGKLQAAMVQFVLYVSVMSPLLATSYLLRGVDLLTIAISLVFALILCVTATAFAVSSAAQAVAPALQGLANLGVAFGLGMGTFVMVGFVGSGGYSRSLGMLLRSSEFTPVVSGIVLLAFLSTTASLLAARTFLLHAFENRSTGFRIFLFSLPVLGYGWMLLFVDARHWASTFPVLAFVLMLVGIVIGVFMVTEQQRLSPRVFAHVPANATWSRLMAPLLPGRDRGLLCFAIYTVLLLGVTVVFWPTTGVAATMRVTATKIGAMMMAYAMVYLGIGRWVRHRLPSGVQGNHAGRFALPFILFLFCVVPLLSDVLMHNGPSDWHIGHVMNPFWTIDHFSDRRDARTAAIVVLLVAAAMQIPVWLRGLGEVRKASAVSRSRLTSAELGTKRSADEAGGSAPSSAQADE